MSLLKKTGASAQDPINRPQPIAKPQGKPLKLKIRREEPRVSVVDVVLLHSEFLKQGGEAAIPRK